MALHALKKITVRDVLKGKIQKETVQVAVLNDDGTPVLGKDREPVTRAIQVAVAKDVVVIYGRAHNHRGGSTSYGDFIEFVGTFEARRIEDGEVFQSTRCIFPPIATDLAEETYFNVKRREPDAAVDFAFVVGIEPDTRGAEGFRFTCKPVLQQASESDPLAELRSSLAMNFAETLGLDVIAKLGLPAPGSKARQIAAPKGDKTPEPA